jgi:serine/threonine protein kinase
VTPTRLLAGRYELLETVGRGGMGIVYLAQDRQLGRRVAVKILPAELIGKPEYRVRFQREAKAVAALSHESIAVVYDVGQDSGGPETVPFIVMEYLTGQTLDQLAGPLPYETVARLACGVLDALDHSHGHGVVHRDIKPSNVMATFVDGRPRVKVLDFGIARMVADTASRLTATGVRIGTPAYMSPEQAEGRPADARSDVYSTGCLLYELLTGRPPFVGDNPMSVMFQHIGKQPDPPSRHRPGLPPGWDPVVLRALAKRPEDRFDAAGMRTAVEAIVRAPVESRTEPPMPPVPPEPRRWGAVIGAAAAGVLVVVGAVAVILSLQKPDPLPIIPSSVPATPDSHQCLVGLWQVTGLPTTIPVAGASDVDATSTGGINLRYAADGTGSAEYALTLTGTYQGAKLVEDFTGTDSFTYRIEGNIITYQRTSNTARTVYYSNGQQTQSNALNQDYTSDRFTCTSNALTLVSASQTLHLTRA